MTQHIVKINSIKYITHDVLRIVTEKPQKHTFTPGQATEISINKEGWIKEKRPFTFTCLPQHDYLEFSIKTYPSHKGKRDIILSSEFKKILGKNLINILSDEKAEGYAHGLITEGFLKSYISDSTKNVYICGPPPMMDAIEKQLINLKIDKKQIIKEAF